MQAKLEYPGTSTHRSPLQAQRVEEVGSSGTAGSGRQTSCSFAEASQDSIGPEPGSRPGSPVSDPLSLSLGQQSKSSSASEHHVYPTSQAQECSDSAWLCDPGSPHPSRLPPTPASEPAPRSSPQASKPSTRIRERKGLTTDSREGSKASFPQIGQPGSPESQQKQATSLGSESSHSPCSKSSPPTPTSWQ